jgi:hypothetical protein
MEVMTGPQGPQCCPIEIDFTKLSDLCELMPRPLLITGILVQWMRQHFTDPKNIENPLLKHSIWSSELSETRIAIDSIFKWDPAHTEARPGIFVKRGPWKVLRYGIDDRKMVGVNDARCTREYNAMCQGSHTLFCIAGESGEVELLAAEIYRELMEFGPVARKLFGFLRFTVTDVGEPSILEEATENFVVPVVVSYGVQDVWTVCPPALQGKR